MNFNIQSDKIIKIYNKINVLSNVKFNYDISLDLNQLRIKKDQEYIFTSYFIDFKNKSISNDILNICEQKNYLNILILNKVPKYSEKFIKLIEKFHLVYGKKIVLVAKKIIWFTIKYLNLIFSLNQTILSKKNFLPNLRTNLQTFNC